MARDDAHVDLDRVRVADALELPLLKHPQKLHLHARTHCADFVEKQRPFVRLLEPALAGADGAGKRAAHVSEQLRLQECLRNRTAVERDETLRAPRAVVMDSARDNLFACSCLACHQDGAGGSRHGFEQLKQVAHGGASADDALELVTLLELRSEVRVFSLEPALLERGVQRVQQFVELKRLGDEVGRPPLDRFDRVLHRSVTGHDDAYDIAVAEQGGFEHASAVEARQTQIGDDDIEGKFSELLDCLLARVGLLHLESVFRQALREGLTQRGFVFDQQQMFLGFSHLQGVNTLTRPTPLGKWKVRRSPRARQYGDDLKRDPTEL